MTELLVRHECFPIKGRFTISRGSKTQADIVLVEITQAGFAGRGECVPYGRYGESITSVMAQIDSVRPHIISGANRLDLADLMPAGAARNAVDAALIDLWCKRERSRAWSCLGIDPPEPRQTCFTISLDEPEAMAQVAADNAHRPILKLKLGQAKSDLDRVKAVRNAAPKCRLTADVNEGWTIGDLMALCWPMANLGVELIEQPLAAESDQVLAEHSWPIAICADESIHGTNDLSSLASRYRFVNIKLDKTGGATAALATIKEARRQGFGLMLGCMVGTSLSMAPASMLMDLVDFVDLDAPLWLAKDREPALTCIDSIVYPAEAALWG